MKAKDIALGGVLVALTIVTLYLTLLIPTNTIAIMTLASLYIPICLIRSNIKTSIFVYVASTIVSLFILPINYSIMYALFFGIYGLVKHFIERLNKIPVEIAIKLVFFNVVLTIGLLTLELFGVNIDMKFSVGIMYLLAQPVFLVYDYALSILITMYYKKFHKKSSL